MVSLSNPSATVHETSRNQDRCHSERAQRSDAREESAGPRDSAKQEVPGYLAPLDFLEMKSL